MGAKILRIFEKVFTLVLTAVGGLIFAGIFIICSVGLYSSIPSKSEVARLSSPDAGLIASVTEVGPTGERDMEYVVKVQNHNQIIGLSRESVRIVRAKRSHCASGVDLEWESPDVLLIKYFQSDAVEWVSEVVRLGGRVVKTKLVQGEPNPYAPCNKNSDDKESLKGT